MGIAFFLVAFAVVLLATFRSLGWGLLAMVAIGYFSGVIRANYLGVITIHHVSPAAAAGPLQR